MPRTAFRLRIKAGKEQEYDAAHRHVWPALLAKLREVGIIGHSLCPIFQSFYRSLLSFRQMPFVALAADICSQRSRLLVAIANATRCGSVCVCL